MYFTILAILISLTYSGYSQYTDKQCPPFRPISPYEWCFGNTTCPIRTQCCRLMDIPLCSYILTAREIETIDCPKYRPHYDNKTCRRNADCPFLNSCCSYDGETMCVLTNPNICWASNKLITKGKIIVLDDNCTECECYGYNIMPCRRDVCFWPLKLRGCYYDGNYQRRGSVFMSTDGCNLCNCTEGKVICGDTSCTRPLRFKTAIG